MDYDGGLTVEQATQMIADAIAGIPTAFVNGGAPMTLDALLTGFPAGAATAGKYGRVSNLYNGVSLSAAGGIDDILRCRYDDTNAQYRWVPQRADWNIISSSTSGTVTLIPLVTPPTMRLTGTLLGNLNIIASATNAWIGMRNRVMMQGTLGVFTATITGLVGSNLTLLGNTLRDIEYSAAGYIGAN